MLFKIGRGVIYIQTLITIIIYHNFLPPPRRGSHVKSDNTHIIINSLHRHSSVVQGRLHTYIKKIKFYENDKTFDILLLLFQLILNMSWRFRKVKYLHLKDTFYLASISRVWNGRLFAVCESINQSERFYYESGITQNIKYYYSYSWWILIPF